MKQNADFDEGISQAQSNATQLPNPQYLTTNKSFQMRYYNGQSTKFQTSNFTKEKVSFSQFLAFTPGSLHAP